MTSPSRRRRRRCALCGLPELTEIPGRGRFFLIPDPEGKGPVCPSRCGCGERQRQLPLLFEARG